ncbi:MAG: glycosyltransferase [Chloroflexi bacterium]|nr:glycosyltransferase [Chloroflexota bacterium]MBI3341390.1 glycosyltransferase [Chloroflexota bacterium]
MRIGMMADVYKPHVSGITNYIDLNKRYLEKAGHDVFVFTFGDQDYRDDEKRVIRSPGLPLVDTGYYLSFSYSLEAKKLLQTMDVIHIHHPFLSGRLGLRYSRPLRIPTVFTNHTRYDLYAQAYMPLLPEEISGSLLQAYIPPFCKAVSLVVSPSEGMANILRAMGVESPIAIVPNGVDLQHFYKAEPLPRADFGFKDSDVLLVYAGRVANEKNLPFLLQSFAGVAHTLDNVYLIIIGGGKKTVEEQLQQLAAELKLQDRVRFTGMISYENLPAYLTMCDAFVTASVTEVHPLSVIEAMGAGLPVLGIQSPGVGDTIEDGKTGFLATENLSAFTAKLTRLCLDASLRKQMGNAARQASTRYAIERTTRTMLEHYEHLVYASRPVKQRWDVKLRGLLEKFMQ